MDKKDKVYECLLNGGASYDRLSEFNKIQFQLFMLFMGVITQRYKWEDLPKEIPSWCLEKVVNLYGQGVLFEIGGQYLVTQAVNNSSLNVYNEVCQVQPVGMNGMSFPVVNVKDTINVNGSEIEYVEQNGVLIKNNIYSIPTYALIKPFIEKLCYIWESAGINAGLSRLVALVHCNKDVAGTIKNEISKIIGNRNGVVVVNEKMNILETINKFDLKVEYTPEKYWEDFDNTFNLICLMVGITTDMNKNKKERVVVAQVESNDELTTIVSNSYLSFRELACDEIKDVFGLNVSVKENKDIKVTNPNQQREFNPPSQDNLDR